MFQKTIISKYLKTQDNTDLTEKWDLFCAHFQNLEIQENIRSSKEEQYQEGFLRDFFVKILGYTLNPTIGFNLTTEYKNIKDSKKADGAIINDEKVVAVIELKGTNTTDLGKVEEQAFNYKNNQTGCTYVITSNFEKLRLYIDDSVTFTEFNLFTLKRDDFNLLYLLLSFDNVKNNIPKKLKDESLNQEDIVTKKLYKDYSVFKQELFQNLTSLNPQFDPLVLFQKSQKLLDRLLFLFFGEDRGLLPPNSVRQVLDQWNKLKDLDAYDPLYNRYKKYFGYLNTGFKGKNHDVFAYNGGLFKDDEILDNIKIDDNLLYNHTFKLSQYDFASEVDVNILGHIFENSLNEIDEIKSQLEGTEIDKSKTKRKKDGVFYTPKYITKYIVENTVGKLCDEKKTEFQIVEEEYFTDKKRQQKTKENLLNRLDTYRKWLLQITIVDPACGSGAFLNEALNFLITEHEYVDELEAKLLNVPIIFSYQSESILEHNLFGVDLNEESVEIAKLSLWLRTAEPNRKLNSLNDNIKCGNSLIDDSEIAGEKAFNWETEFPQVFKKGGFDVVIGNPPYVSKSFTQNIKDYLNNNFQTSSYQLDLYISFIEKGIFILKNSGKISYITPNSWLKNLTFDIARRYFLENLNFEIIIPNLDNVFADASVDTMIFIGNKNKAQNQNRVEIGQFKTFEYHLKHFVDQHRFSKNHKFNFDVEVSDEWQTIISKITRKSVYLETISDITRGVNPYDKYRGQSQETIENKIFHSYYKKNETFVPELRGRHIERYLENWDNKSYISYGDWLAAPREEKYFIGPRILCRQILGKNLNCTFIDENYIIDQSVFIAKFNDIFLNEINPKFILAQLTSNLVSKFFRFTSNEFDSLFPKIKIGEYKKLPVLKLPLQDQKIFIDKADLMLSLNKEFQKASYKFQKLCERKFEGINLTKKLQNWYELTYSDFIKALTKQKIKLTLSEESDWETYFEQEKTKALEIQSQITTTDKEIDQMVYELYGLTEDEIKIIEE